MGGAHCLWRPPTLGLLLRLDDVAVTALLEKLVAWIVAPPPAARLGEAGSDFRAFGIEQGSAMWLFALLGRVDTPLVTDTQATLHDLARFCKAHPDCPSSRMILCVCRDAFGQGG